MQFPGSNPPPLLQHVTSDGMHFKNESVGFHNVADFESAPGGGVWLRRFPASVRRSLSPLGQKVSEDAAGCEVRFVCESSDFTLILSLGENTLDPIESHPSEVLVYRGAFFHSRHVFDDCSLQRITISDPGKIWQRRFEKLAELPPKYSGADWFSPKIWRIVFYSLEFSEGFSRAPVAAEVPRLRWLAYGSSITHGSLALSHHNAFVYHAARVLKADVLNLGLAGSAFGESEVADDIASRPDWDIVTLELGVNMRGAFSPDQFSRRAAHFLKTIHSAHPDKFIFVTGVFANLASPGIELDGPSDLTKRELSYQVILRDLVASLNAPHCHFIEPSEILQDFTGLSADLIHPADHGMAFMGANLARAILQRMPIQSVSSSAI